MPSVSKVLNPGTMAQSGGGVSWTNINNAKVEDAVVATSGLIGPGGGGGIPKQLDSTNYGFNLPSNAVIDGIKLRIKVDGGAGNNDAPYIYLLYNGGSTNVANTPNSGQNWFHGGTLTWQTYGNTTSLWGRAWTAAEINHTNFGASVATMLNTGTGTVTIDAIEITVYYHIGGSITPVDVSTREVYKVYNQDGNYIGNLPRPTNPLKITQDINSLGSQINLNIPVSPDTSALPADIYTTEDASENYTDESAATNYTTEGQLPIVSAALQGIDTLIKNGNTVQAWIYNYWYPNGKCMFIGKIRRWEANFGGDGASGDSINVLLYSNSYDLDNYVTRGAPFSYIGDQSQTSQNASETINQVGGGYNRSGQTFKVGTGVTNLGAITLYLLGTAQVTINVYDIPNGGTLLGSTTQNVDVSSATSVQFGFANLINVTAGNTYFFEVLVADGQSITIYYQNTDVYANGSHYTANYGGGGGGGYSTATGDLYFATASGTGSTSATFTSKDPSTQMLEPIITDYNLRGGTQVWTVVSIDATGLSLTYTFNVQTIYEAMQAILSLSPNGFYYYIDLGTQTIYFKNASTTADYLIQKGVHINSLTLIASNENSVNTFLFTGGESSPGVNLYKQYSDSVSIAAFGILLARKTDNRVTLSATADAIGNSEIAERKNEQYQTKVKLAHTKSLDITLLTPGKIIGFRGFGTFVDQLLMQVVRREWLAEEVTLTLGILPIRTPIEQETIKRQLIAEQTQNNPSAPS